MSDHAQRLPRRARRYVVIPLAAAVFAVAVPPAAALTSSGSGMASMSDAETTAPPQGGWVAEGESLQPGTRHQSSAAHGGAFLRTRIATARSATDGFHELTLRVRGTGGSRVRITVNGETVAAYTLGTAWERIRAVASIPSGGSVGVEAEALPWVGDARDVDLDWIHATAHEPVHATAGNRIVDLAGSPTLPRGVTAPGYQAPQRNADGRLQLLNSMAAAHHAWGMALVRLPLNQEHWLADCPSVKDGVTTSYRAAVADEVNRLTQRGIVAMLTLTRTERGKATGCTPAAQPTFKEMADQRSPAFWQSVASRFSSNPRVVFDLFNEPHKISDDVWHHGGTVTYTENVGGLSFQRTYQAVGMQTLYDTVRATGADNLVFVSGTNWASDPRALMRRPLDGYGIVGAVHTYCHDCSPPRLNPLLDTLVDADVRSRHPLMITETGWIDPHTSAYNRPFLDWAEQRGLGWTIYGWGHPKADYSILLEWTPPSFPVGGGVVTFRPSMSGTPVWNELADVRVSRGYDAKVLAEPAGSAPPQETTTDSEPGTVEADDPSTDPGSESGAGPAPDLSGTPGSWPLGFADVRPGSAHATAIQWLVDSRITAGCSADGKRYCPAAPVTRAQMATILTRALTLPAGTATFADVRRTDTHAAGIAALARIGITTGCDGTRFCPDQPITRSQMATFLHRALGD